MAIGRPKVGLVLSAEEQAQVSALAGSRSLPHAMVGRAQLVLWAAQGESNSVIAQRLGWSMLTVHHTSVASRKYWSWRPSAFEPLKGQVAMRDAIPGPRIAVIDGRGHEIYVDQAEACSTAVLRFISSLSS